MIDPDEAQGWTLEDFCSNLQERTQRTLTVRKDRIAEIRSLEGARYKNTEVWRNNVKHHFDFGKECHPIFSQGMAELMDASVPRVRKVSLTLGDKTITRLKLSLPSTRVRR